MGKRGLLVLGVFLMGSLAAGAAPGAPPPAPAASASSEPGECRYGSRAPEKMTRDRGEADQLSRAEAAAVQEGMRQRLRSRRPDGGTELTIPVYIHIITDGRHGATVESVDRQVDILNDAYGGRFGGADTKTRFTIEEITITKNRTWFSDPLGNERAMKRRLREGGPGTLNLFFAQLSDEVLGFSTYPFRYDRDPEVDGVVIDWRSMPGGSMRHFNYGYTAVHEIGHWLGLLHTFENGCEPPGDLVSDTPAEAHSTQGCPRRKDTCPDDGPDPIHNFMGYAHDRCMSEFTAGQARRIHESWIAYRA